MKFEAQSEFELDFLLKESLKIFYGITRYLYTMYNVTYFTGKAR